MESQIKQCQNCKNDFVIEPEDFLFYEKIKVPAPTFCPECRFLRRISFGNYSTLYKRDCDSCGKSTICIYTSDKSYKMYCGNCWWKDNWDGTEYGQEYDSSQQFFDQFKELENNSIFMSLEALFPSLINTVYTNHSGYQKNCFMTIMADYDENCAYCTIVAHCKDCLDCYRVKESELCYECVGIYKCYNCMWSEELDSCVNCRFCQSCYGCQNCIGCVNLRNKNYFIFNEQYSKDDYENLIKELSLDTNAGISKLKGRIDDFWLKNPKKYYHGNGLNVNVTGDYIYESKNTKESYLVSGAEDCKYVQQLTLRSSKDCFDYTSWGNGAELLYECYVVGEGAYNNKFCIECWPQGRDLEYCLYCINCKDCFGCVNLKKKQYCILNRQYTKEEYFELKNEIIKNMEKNPWKNKVGHIYNYGEFFPPEFSPFGYNESIVNEQKPLSKIEAEKYGFNWYDLPVKEYNFTIGNNELPDSISQTKDSIKKEVIKCETCGRGYNISDLELELLNKLNQPIPHQCSNCRHLRRFNRTNKSILYDRTCDNCGVKIRTSYSPDRPEIVYCEKCYQQEVY